MAGSGDGPTPQSEITLREGSALYPRRLRDLFPRDPALRRWGAESYFGVALRGRAGVLLGELAIFHDEPLFDLERIRYVTASFATRAAAEIERKRDALRGERGASAGRRAVALRETESRALDAISAGTLRARELT